MAEGQREFIREPARDIPVYRKVDVIVAGSGPAGIGAALAAARNGADTLLVERNGFLGGMATASMQSWFGGPTDIVAGISKEIAETLDELGAVYKAIIPFTIADIVRLAIIIALPVTVTWLPGQMF